MVIPIYPLQVPGTSVTSVTAVGSLCVGFNAWREGGGGAGRLKFETEHLTSKFIHISVKTVISLSKKYESFEIIIISEYSVIKHGKVNPEWGGAAENYIM